eukprot:TRINITY_DN4088_c0_g1_i1.p1 TRINITY_DN4088_c0_g1~~TRINITY_DN4088_c0_g1_i1.p1  ORF type:complete len:175 (-),score=23.85 TRINITY_DN4088_c0_g1_i1:76-600(-)
MKSTNINPFEGLVRLFEKDGFALFSLKDQQWVDNGRGRLRIWKRGSDGVKWVSLVSVGTKREILTMHEFLGNKVNNRIVLNHETTFDPELYEDGVLVTSHERHFLFRSLKETGAAKSSNGGEESNTEGNETSTFDPKEDAKIAVAKELIGVLHLHSVPLPSPIRAQDIASAENE